MPSTVHTTNCNVGQEQTKPVHWRSWPLVDHWRWSWLAIAGLLAAGGAVWYLDGGWTLAAVVMVGLAGTTWQYFVPVSFEIDTLGLRRIALRRTRLIPWHAIRAYQPRPTGIVLYQRDDPTKLDLLRSVFVPFPADEDEMVCAMREHLGHATEVPM